MKIEIIFLLCIIFLYNYFIPPEYVNDDMTNSSKFFVPLAMLGLFSFLVFVVIISSIFYYRTLNYVNHFKDINLLLDKDNSGNNHENNKIEKYYNNDG